MCVYIPLDSEEVLSGLTVSCSDIMRVISVVILILVLVKHILRQRERERRVGSEKRERERRVGNEKMERRVGNEKRGETKVVYTISTVPLLTL